MARWLKEVRGERHLARRENAVARLAAVTPLALPTLLLYSKKIMSSNLLEDVSVSQQNYLAADQHWTVQQRRKKIVQPRWLRRLQPGRETPGSSKLQR